MELSVTFHTIVRLLFLFYLQGGSKVIGQFTDLIGMLTYWKMLQYQQMNQVVSGERDPQSSAVQARSTIV